MIDQRSNTTDEWFKTAVFYEVLLRAFADSNSDGVGDFAGMTAKLDYLAWLGVDCVWLPPFFPSPLADGGYDVADYTGVAADVGTLEDFTAFVAAAHERGIRVIIDFVMNHTSDQHPWFQASRNDPTGPYGDFYVWADSPDAYPDARIIFLDTETSNWTFDEVRGQYFWHRFYSHQPDLNFEHSPVFEALWDAVAFWLGRGIDGFRLDAVPYLVEENGTNCENLPGTHAILKELRRRVDEQFPGKILLCEANQWPHDVVEYFGAGDECHLAFHFPVMPRLYMALRRGDRTAISQILADTPAIPAGCQWGTFLRNHDELTLEMVTPDEREWMWGEYAPEPRMRSNLGIRRRLAPLMDGDLDRIKVLHAMLLSLPGSPVLYYGDEIGMGDDIWLNDRDGVRTPMQWTPDPETAGFSSADPATFYLPLVTSPGFRPLDCNVADQRCDSASLLVWLRDLLALRRRHPVFGLGSFTDLGGDNTAVLAYRRGEGLDEVWCYANLSASPQRVSVPRAGLIDLVSGTPAHEHVDLSRYGFAWLATRP